MEVVFHVDFGRLMHPIESSKFTNGELNNAMGSDFYQRDRGLKQKENQEKEKRKTSAAESSEDSDASSE